MIVILNTTSGSVSGDDRAAAAVDKALKGAGVTAELWRAGDGNALPKLVQKALAAPDETIVGAGGDGTINAVASALVDTSKRLGVLPMGTLNHFAKDLGLPLTLDAAVQTLVTGEERRVDVGEVNGHVFINNSSIGLYPRVVRHREAQRQQLGRGKWPAFAWAVLSALHVCPSLRLRLVVDGQAKRVRTPFLFVGNNAYRMNILRIGERDHLDQGVLSVYHARNSSRRGLIALALRSLLGRVEQADNFEALSTPELRVELRRRAIDVSVDGEVICLTSPLVYRIRPRALRVIGPAGGGK